MRNFITVYNEGYGEEMILFEVSKDNKLEYVMYGDEYHDKIQQAVRGFFIGLKYADVDYQVLARWEGCVESQTLDCCDITFDGEDIVVWHETSKVEVY